MECGLGRQDHPKSPVDLFVVLLLNLPFVKGLVLPVGVVWVGNVERFPP